MWFDFRNVIILKKGNGGKLRIDYIPIIVSLISGILSLLGVVITVKAGNKKVTNQITTQLDKSQAITEYKVEELTREVREHNNFARRMPVVEEQIKVINHRIADLESKGE